MKINKFILGNGIFGICMGIILILSDNVTIFWVYLLGFAILITGIYVFLSGIQLNKNEVLK